MQKYYNWDSDTVITIDDVKKAYEADDSWKEEYGNFDYYLECCQDYNNGSLTRLEIMISRLKSKMCQYYKYEDSESAQVIELWIAQLDK